MGPGRFALKGYVKGRSIAFAVFMFFITEKSDED